MMEVKEERPGLESELSSPLETLHLTHSTIPEPLSSAESHGVEFEGLESGSTRVEGRLLNRWFACFQAGWLVDQVN